MTMLCVTYQRTIVRATGREITTDNTFVIKLWRIWFSVVGLKYEIVQKYFEAPTIWYVSSKLSYNIIIYLKGSGNLW